MTKYAVTRIFRGVVTALAAVIVTFAMVRLLPGDPVTVFLGDYATPEAKEALRRAMGLDRPLMVQLALYLKDVIAGEMGASLRTGEPVRSAILRAFGPTLQLAAASMVVAALVALPLGVYAARRRNQLGDVLAMVFAVAGRSVPHFWLGILGLLVFALRLHWVPVVGSQVASPIDVLRGLVLPALVLGSTEAALLTRLTRSSMLDTLSQDYVRTARAKGLRERRVLYNHALRNAFTSVWTATGLSFGRLLGGSIVVEKVFTRVGLGQLLVESIGSRDYPMIQGLVLTFTTIMIACNLVVDVGYGLLDPRIRR